MFKSIQNTNRIKYIIGLLPSLNSKNTIMVIMDQFTKMIRLKVTTIAVLLKKIAKIYLDKI